MSDKEKITPQEVESNLKKKAMINTNKEEKDAASSSVKKNLVDKTPAKKPAVERKEVDKKKEEKVTVERSETGKTKVSESSERSGLSKKEEKQVDKEPGVSEKAKTKEKLEDKIEQNIKGVKDYREKIEQAEDEIESLEEEKKRATIGEKIKKVIYFCPKLCVEANVCKYPKIIGDSCKKLVASGTKASIKGVKFLGSLPSKYAGPLKSNAKLPFVRRKIQKTFYKLGDCVYHLYLDGEKDASKNKDFTGYIEKIKKYEKEIEELEASIIRVDKDVLNEQKA